MNKNNVTFEGIRIWTIDITIAAGEKIARIQDQAFLNDKIIEGVFVSGETKNLQDQTLTNSGFYLQIEDDNNRINNIPSKFLNFENEQVVSFGFKNIDWNKSSILFPANVVANTYVQLVVLYRYPEAKKL